MRNQDLILKDMISIIKVEPKRLQSIIMHNKMLKHQVDLFEGERKQLVEAAFNYSKESRELRAKLMQAESEKDLIEANIDQYSSELTFYKVVSVISLLVVLALSVKMFS